MAKLLSSDYLKIIKETYDLPESDYENHYLNKININYPQNRDIVNNLLYELNQLMREYDYEVSSLIKDQPKEFLKSVERTLVQIPIETALGFTTIDGQFFILSKAILNKIANLIELTNEITEIEKSNTQKQITELNKIAEFPKSFNSELLNERLQAQKLLLTKTVSTNTPQLNSLDELFIERYRNYISCFIEILYCNDQFVDGKKTTKKLKPLLDTDGKWINNSQAARVYYESLFEKKIVLNFKDTNYAKIFEEKFGLNCSFVSKEPGPRATDYEAYFKREIDKILVKIDKV
jgi:hypothetical protein